MIESEDELLAASPLGTARLRGGAAAPGPLRPGVLTSVIDGSYNGKIDGPQALPHALTADGLLGRAGQPPGAAAVAAFRYVNSPAQRATGHNWSGATPGLAGLPGRVRRRLVPRR